MLMVCSLHISLGVTICSYIAFNQRIVGEGQRVTLRSAAQCPIGNYRNVRWFVQGFSTDNNVKMSLEAREPARFES